ncbi:MAG: YkgJ family cysteine cluster protein [Lentisphaerae bacterium]|jgi:lysine-N-methylase|nr:YkgJ family cysteine cluster protein [Lentisphaerota bacterium]MBT4814973.1 YkgJ family cysteine cluster protein [Lentisphaerota bacterium]MBT5604610.1 YkgJ family cysteine cluster protein [Lentisphaerota bacterium]MBT7055920.1 YkgJ family cysteine cluster protein [Lentisphaerota bacterium]MBT7847896.1 YkgJ family cysteine cluster protein [Lentisphaerota bacterium]
MAKGNVTIAADQRYTCILCGKCCRRFHVLMKEREIEEIAALDWGGEPDVPADFVHRIRGLPYFRRNDDGACVFLDCEHDTCRMHSRFGFDAKALTCRGYPYCIVSTFWGEVSVLARMDCPGVRRNQGDLIRKDKPTIMRLIHDLGPRGGFSAEQLEGLSRESIELITNGLRDFIHQNEEQPQHVRACSFSLAVERFRLLGTGFLKDTATLAEVLPSFFQRVMQEAETLPWRGLGPFARSVFRHLLAVHLRRDEEIVDPTVGRRLRRTLELARYTCGNGSFGVLGAEHPDFPLRKARLFRSYTEKRTTTTTTVAEQGEMWDCFWRLLLTRLETLQFFGAAYYDQPFFTGLRALSMAYPLVFAAARYHAAADGSDRIRAEDVDYGVGAIDHCLGRSPLLQVRAWRSVEEYFAGPRFGRLLRALGLEPYCNADEGS